MKKVATIALVAFALTLTFASCAKKAVPAATEAPSVEPVATEIPVESPSASPAL